MDPLDHLLHDESKPPQLFKLLHYCRTCLVHWGSLRLQWRAFTTRWSYGGMDKQSIKNSRKKQPSQTTHTHTQVTQTSFIWFYCFFCVLWGRGLGCRESPNNLCFNSRYLLMFVFTVFGAPWEQFLLWWIWKQSLCGFHYREKASAHPHHSSAKRDLVDPKGRVSLVGGVEATCRMGRGCGGVGGATQGKRGEWRP